MTCSTQLEQMVAVRWDKDLVLNHFLIISTNVYLIDLVHVWCKVHYLLLFIPPFEWYAPKNWCTLLHTFQKCLAWRKKVSTNRYIYCCMAFVPDFGRLTRQNSATMVLINLPVCAAPVQAPLTLQFKINHMVLNCASPNLRWWSMPHAKVLAEVLLKYWRLDIFPCLFGLSHSQA